MAASRDIILYDIPNLGGKSWSLNPWKARLSLNYKAVPYKTQWVEYPDLAPTLRKLGIPPNERSDLHLADYTTPAATLPDGSHVMDSIKIAHALEKLQPEPSLRLDNGYVLKAVYAVKAVHEALMPVVMPRVPRQMHEPSAAYFRETRAKRLGMPLDDLEKSDRGGETAWKAAEKPIDGVRALLAEHEGPFVEGGQVSFADFVIAGWLRFYETMDRDGDLFGRIVDTDPVFGRLYEACSKWLERDDH